MNLLKIVTSQVIRFMTIEPSEGQTLYGINLVKAFESHYGFFVGPKTVEDLSLSNGISFRHGIFDRRTVIDQVKLYNNGILAEGAVSTDELYNFITDVVKWISHEAGITVKNDDSNSPIYHSVLNVATTIDFSNHFDSANAIASLIDEKIRSYGSNIPSFQLTGITFQSSVIGRAPTPFNLERLAGAPFETNAYFSTSSLKTSDHLEVLSKIENLYVA